MKWLTCPACGASCGITATEHEAGGCSPIGTSRSDVAHIHHVCRCTHDWCVPV